MKLKQLITVRKLLFSICWNAIVLFPVLPISIASAIPVELADNAAVTGVNLSPSEESLHFAQEHCQGDTYLKIVEITSPRQLVPVIQALSEDDPETWVTLEKHWTKWYNRASPWRHQPGSAKGGVLYLLPPGTDYLIENYISDHEISSSRKKRSANPIIRNKRSYIPSARAPRIGLCGLDEGSNSRSQVRIQLRGGTANTGTDGNNGDAPITLVETQLELYNLTLDGSGTHSQQSSIILYDARLIADNVAFYRSGNIMPTGGSASTEASSSPGFVEYGLVYLDYSYLHFTNSSLTQNTETGSMFNSFVSDITFDRTEVTPYGRTWVFYTYFSDLAVTNCVLHGIERYQSRPVFIDTQDRYKFQGAYQKSTCESIQPPIAAACSDCPETFACWWRFVIDTGYDAITDSCANFDYECKNNNLMIGNNHFRGDWEYLAHSYLDYFKTTDVTTGLDVTTSLIESTEANCLVDSDLYYRSNLQVSHSWGSGGSGGSGGEPFDCSTSEPVPESATSSPGPGKRSVQPLSSRAVYNRFRANRLLTTPGPDPETPTVPEPISAVYDDSTASNQTPAPPDSQTSSAFSLEYSLPIAFAVFLMASFFQ